jgi:iron complex transport system permease protein
LETLSEKQAFSPYPDSRRAYLVLIVLLGGAFTLNLALGAVSVPPGDVIRLLLNQVPGISLAGSWPASYEVIILRIRLPHAALVSLTGAALAGSGAAYQGLFRNPLADPYLIGVASGAGLGAVLAMAALPALGLTLFSVPAAAFLAALGTVTVVYTFARWGGYLSTTTLILAGIAVASFASALTSFLMLRSQGELRRAVAWLMGGSTLSGWEPVLAALPYVAAGLAVLYFSGHSLNILQFGEEQASQLGLPVERVKLLLLGAASLTTAAAVSFSGVVGFIGLVVPHLSRLVWGPDYRRLIPFSILGGAATLLLADLLARLVLAPEVLPVGIVTALAGAPFFLWVLRRSRGLRGAF